MNHWPCQETSDYLIFTSAAAKMPRGTSFSLSLSLTLSHICTHPRTYVHVCVRVQTHTHTHVLLESNESRLIVTPSWNLCLSRHVCGAGDLADQAHSCNDHNIIRGCHLFSACCSILRIVLRKRGMSI